MNRRNFILQSSLATVGAAFSIPDSMKGFQMGIVVHSYGNRWQSKLQSRNYPAFENAIDLLEHCHRIGAGGIQVMVKNWNKDISAKLRAKSEQYGMYIEGSISLPASQNELHLFEQEMIHAKEAGVRVLRTVTSSGRRYEALHSEQEVAEFKRKALASLRLTEPLLRKHKLKLAVENHKDWRADELVQALEELKTEWIGVTLDFGNSISLLEEPMDVIRKLVPYVLSTHVKDMGVEEYKDGFLLSELPLGRGILDLPAIFALCRKHNPAVTFSLEMITRDPLRIPCLTKEYWQVFQSVPGSELANMLRLVKEKQSAEPLPGVVSLTGEAKLETEENNILACLRYAQEKNIFYTE